MVRLSVDQKYFTERENVKITLKIRFLFKTSTFCNFPNICVQSAVHFLHQFHYSFLNMFVDFSQVVFT